MNYKEVDGDLIKLAKNGEFNIIVHGCNTFATMGAGIAVDIKENFPSAFYADKVFLTDKPNKFKLGRISYSRVRVADNKELIVVNAYTQYVPGPDFRLPALVKALSEIQKRFAKKGEKLKIAFPKIGCGIGGGDWDIVKDVIVQELSGHFEITFVYFNPPVKNVRRV